MHARMCWSVLKPHLQEVALACVHDDGLNLTELHEGDQA
jgi:hypothetical protein